MTKKGLNFISTFRHHCQNNIGFEGLHQNPIRCNDRSQGKPTDCARNIYLFNKDSRK